jgi:aspartate racemase
MTFANDWDGIAALITKAAITLQNAGANCMMLGANTMHKIADQVQSALDIPLIHIADATAAAIKEKQLSAVALLGTKYTMQLDFYKNRLQQHGIETIIPGEDDVQVVNDAIYNEMGKGVFNSSTRQQYNQIIEKMVNRGAQGVIMGCTEIPLLLKQEEIAVPLFDTAFLHAKAAVAFALS